MTIDILYFIVVLGVMTALAVPMGMYLARTFTGTRHLLSERWTYRLFGVDPDVESGWKGYALGLVLSNAAMMLLGYLLLHLQLFLPLNPLDLAPQSPDLVVLDLGLPDMDGFEVLTEIRSWSQVPIMILSVRSNEHEKVRALDAGANDYVTKPFGMSEFLARVRSLLRNQPQGSPQPGLHDDGYLAIDLAHRRITVQGEPLHLTRKEFDVLKTLFAHHDRVVTQTHLLKGIWGPTHADDTHYLRVIVGRLRQKLGDDPTDPRYILTEPGVGYRLAIQA